MKKKIKKNKESLFIKYVHTMRACMLNNKENSFIKYACSMRVCTLKNEENSFIFDWSVLI